MRSCGQTRKAEAKALTVRPHTTRIDEKSMQQGTISGSLPNSTELITN
jgi:hypothetical protein